MMYILYSLTSLSAVLQEVVSVTVSTIQYSNAYHSIQYYYTIALILIIIIFVFAHKLTNVITMPNTSTFSASMLRVYKCACVIKFHLGKWRPIPDQIFVVVETVLNSSFIVSEDIVSILYDQNINATGMVLESS